MNRLLLFSFLILFQFSINAQEPTITFQNTVGGDDWDRCENIITTSDGGYLLIGISKSSASFDKTEDVIGGDDAWVVKFNSEGLLEWENTIGGNDDERLKDRCLDERSSMLEVEINSHVAGRLTIAQYGTDHGGKLFHRWTSAHTAI